MDGTTLCPHCNTRFRIAELQLTLRGGMVRCGHCLKPFDARSTFISWDQSRGSAEHSSLMSVDFPIEPLVQQSAPVLAIGIKQKKPQRPTTKLLAGIFAFLLLITLTGQTIYFFRVDLATHYPNLKASLLAYCHLLNCEVPLQQRVESMSIETSNLETVPEHEDQIILNALLRNRSAYPQAFPHLELTLNDTQDKALARRIFHPMEYLPHTEKERTGLIGNNEVAIKVHLNISNLKATGYRLVLFYPKDTL